jgi:hypothetical protein
MRLEVMRRPDPLHRTQRDPGHLGHRPAGPVGGVAGRLGAGERHYSPHGRVGQGCLAGLAGRVAQEAVDAGFGEPALPAPDRRPTPARRATSATLSRAAAPRMIRARATCFWARLRSATIASRRARSSAETNGQEAEDMNHLQNLR